MVTLLGCGVEMTWKRLTKGDCGIRALTPEDIKMNGFDSDTQSYTFDQLPFKVAAIVPCESNPGEFNEELWLNSKDHCSMARFIGYAMCAAEEALKDAKWMLNGPEERERMGVSVGGGTRSISDILDAAQMICKKVLINMASGCVSMKYGFTVREQLFEIHFVCYECYVDKGTISCYSNNCVTRAHSLGDATKTIQFGDSDVMVAGGAESNIDALSTT